MWLRFLLKKALTYTTFLEVNEHLAIISFCSETQKCFESYASKSVSLSLQSKCLEKTIQTTANQVNDQHCFFTQACLCQPVHHRGVVILQALNITDS